LVKAFGPVAACLGLGLYGLAKMVYVVDGGHLGIKFSRFHGVMSKVYREGWHLRIPYFEWPIIFEVRSQPRILEAQTGSKDLQQVDISVRIMYRPNAERLPDCYRFVGKDYDHIPSFINEVVKTVVAQYTAAQLLNQREQVSFTMRKALQERTKDFFIDIDDVSIIHLAFSQEFHKAVEEKQSAQQDAERAKFLVEQALQDKKSIIIKAQGEAISAELIGKSMNPAYIELKRIETARKIAETLSQSNNRAILDSDTLMLNLVGPINQRLMSLGEKATPA
jgi:prohibitin 2